MALPWLALIKAVPWTDVVAHAPTVLAAAKKLWRSPSGQALGGAAPSGSAETPPPLSARVVEVEAQLAEALAHLSDTHQLVQDMAEQQARMLVQIEDNRRALRRATGLAAVAGVLAVGLLIQAVFFS